MKCWFNMWILLYSCISKFKTLASDHERIECHHFLFLYDIYGWFSIMYVFLNGQKSKSISCRVCWNVRTMYILGTGCCICLLKPVLLLLFFIIIIQTTCVFLTSENQDKDTLQAMNTQIRDLKKISLS